VGFNLVTWPAQNGVWVSLMVGGTPFNVYRVSWQFEPSEAYGAYLPPAGTTVSATGTTGTLRLTREGDIFTAYYRSGDSWVPIISGTGPTGDVPLTLGSSTSREQQRSRAQSQSRSTTSTYSPTASFARR